MSSLKDQDTVFIIFEQKEISLVGAEDQRPPAFWDFALRRLQAGWGCRPGSGQA